MIINFYTRNNTNSIIIVFFKGEENLNKILEDTYANTLKFK